MMSKASTNGSTLFILLLLIYIVPLSLSLSSPKLSRSFQSSWSTNEKEKEKNEKGEDDDDEEEIPQLPPPWWSPGTSKQTTKEDNEDHTPTVFSSMGRLLGLEKKVEAASSALDPTSNLVVACRFKDGIVIMDTGHLSPYIDHVAELKAILKDQKNLPENNKDDEKKTSSSEKSDDDSTFLMPLLVQTLPSTTILQVGPQLYSITAGNAMDSQLLQDKIFQTSQSLWQRLQVSNSGSTFSTSMRALVSAKLLARHVADQLQRCTQTESAGRILASSALMADGNLNLWRVDPTGQFFSCRAAAIGKQSVKADQWLSRYFLNNDDNSMTRDEAIQCVANCLNGIMERHELLGTTRGFIITAGATSKRDENNIEWLDTKILFDKLLSAAS